ncbi:anticodon nuclease [Flavobacterium piscinae]|uniref:Anticodon nuclease n=1 Tax=Flavobacterium piscinae TaxID=2506424 RepID=A0A4V1N593_9FLAO|nr:AAA family ATPase [Flavobacterium piscinae]RXR34866.1 anticodon nuclease [Flavobacterium piscinae]
MAQSLTEIAQSLIDANKKVQLIYAFNGTGKTRLSREFRLLVAPKNGDDNENNGIKVMYYNAFTEDLFFWDNDLDTDVERKLTIRPNNFTNLALGFLKDQGQDFNIISNFQHYTSQSITPKFSEDFSEVTFSLERGGDDNLENIKISKGEESNFIWCVFFSLLEQVVEIKNMDPENRPTDDFNSLEYVFIDDPVSSLDDNHLIELAVNLATLFKKSSGIQFVVSTHNPLFYNVVFNELSNKTCYMLKKFDDGTFELKPLNGDSNKSFSYHLYIKNMIEEAIATNTVEKYHFMLLRNLYEKTANFLGYPEWKRLLPEDRQLYYNRIIQFTSHSTLSNEAVPDPTEPEKQTVKLLLEHLVNSKYWKEEIQNNAAAQIEPEIPINHQENDTL